MSEAIRQGDIPGVQLRCRQALTISQEEAWKWLSRSERLCSWLARRVELDLGDAGWLELHDPLAGEEVQQERGSTLEIEPPRRWVLAFRRTDEPWQAATRLTLELEPREGGCELSVLQQGFEHLPLSDCLTIWEIYRRRWRAALAMLAEVCNPHLREPDPSEHV